MRLPRIHAAGARATALAFACAIAAALAFAPRARAQSTEIPGPPQRTAIVLRHVDVRTCTRGHAPIPDGYLVFDKGRIVAVGAEPMPAGLEPEDAQVIEAKGMVVTPGLWAGDSTIGLIETEQVAATDDRSEFGDDRPEIRAASAANPDSDLPPVARNAGILMAHVFPEGGVVAGHASAMRLDGWTAAERVANADAGLILRWPMMETVNARWMDRSARDQRKERDRTLERIDRFFDAAQAYLRAREADGSLPMDSRFEGMRGALAGREPVLLEANWPGQIEAGVLWCVRRGLKPVVVGGLGAPEVTPLLREHQVPVIISGVHRLPLRSGDPYDTPYTVAKRLADAGVEFAIATGGSAAHERNLPAQCGTAVAYGLPRDRALEAITRVPAELAGVGDRYGTLEPGRSATVVLFSGDPLELTTQVRRAWIDGAAVDLNDRQKRMRTKYLEKQLQREDAAAAPAPAPTPAPAPAPASTPANPPQVPSER